MQVVPICLWCRDFLDETHSPDECREQFLSQDDSGDAALTALRAALVEQPTANAPDEDLGA
jgi:hypothetical protein